MAEHMIETRILLRYDTLSNWMASELILKQGEVAVAKIPYGTTIGSSDHTPLNTPPAIGLKVGDGVSYFNELPWVQGIAGDVYNWAKQQTKPTYTANEIQGLDTYIQEHGGGSGGGSGSDTPTPVASRIYQIVRGTGGNVDKYYLQYRTSDSNDWTIDTTHYIDLAQLTKITNWLGEDLDDYFTLGGRIYDGISTELQKLNVSDSYSEGRVVTSVEQVNGKISVGKSQLNLNTLTGPLSASLGGTGLTTIGANEILVGNANNGFTLRTIETTVDNTNNLATNQAIQQYVTNATAGLAGAMHYVGEATVEINSNGASTVNPQIAGYNFSNVQLGDVITQNQKEFVWDGAWRLLGDEGSYAIKGSITNVDISPDANISQSKITNLTEDLSNKVDVVEGKGLSTNDYTTEDRNKLSEIEEGAQVNAIEHVFVNDIERPIITVNGQPKSITLSIDVFDEEHATKLDGIQAGAQVNTIEHILVNGEEKVPLTIGNLSKAVNITFNPYTTADQLKLQGIEAGAQVNTIERIFINNTEYTPDEFKKVSITLDQAALNLNVLEGAQYIINNTKEDIAIDNKKLQLAHIAATGNVRELLQTSDTYIILDCGSSTEVI